jgi:hypothetical protein
MNLVLRGRIAAAKFKDLVSVFYFKMRSSLNNIMILFSYIPSLLTIRAT